MNGTNGIWHSISEPVARVTIDRPKVNALDLAAQDTLRELFDHLEQDPRVRVIVLTGAGERAFCAGADMSGHDMDGLEYFQRKRPGGFGGISLRPHTVPLIARVNAHARGGGFEMVLGADLVIASDQATFALPEAKVGRVPLDGGIHLLHERLPKVVATELLLTCRVLSAADALRYGLVNEITPARDLDFAVNRMISDLLAAAPQSQRAILHLAHQGRHLPAEQAVRLQPPELTAALTSPDGREGPLAFREKRPPRWATPAPAAPSVKEE